ETAHPKLEGTIHSAAEAIEQAGGQALRLVVDVRDEAAVKSAIAQTVTRFGSLDIVVNNASAISLTPVAQTDMKRPAMYISVLETAEVVAERYKISRERQDKYSLECQRRTASALQGRRFSDELVPIATKMTVIDKKPKRVSLRNVTLAQDEGPRPDTTADALAKIKPGFEGKPTPAGNASQLSDGASACVVMSHTLAAQKGLKPLGVSSPLALSPTRWVLARSQRCRGFWSGTARRSMISISG